MNPGEAVPAIIPAAGRSLRMGRAKPLLILDGETLIERVVRAFCQGGAHPVIVIAPPATEPSAMEIADLATRSGAITLHPVAATGDMKKSILCGLAVIQAIARDFPGILLGPADFPGISPGLVARVLGVFREGPGRIVIPTHDRRRGHPIALPRALCDRIPCLDESEGVNALIRREMSRIVPIEIADPRAFDDLDTPEDYRHWLASG